jgi:hypothetical protein
MISRKSLFLLGGLAVSASLFLTLNSCTPDDRGGVHIPVPKDTSDLAQIDHFISVDQINSFRGRFGAQRDTLARQFPGLYIPLSETFNKQSLLDLLKDSTNVGIRIYYGIKPGSNRNEMRLMLVGVNSQGKDLFYQRGGDGGKVAAQLPPATGVGGVEYGQCDPPCFK